MATHFTTWQAVYQILQAEHQTLFSEKGDLPAGVASPAGVAERQLFLESEISVRLQQRGGIVDEACSVFAHTQRWPAMSQSLAVFLAARLAAARDLAAFIS